MHIFSYSINPKTLLSDYTFDLPLSCWDGYLNFV